MTTATPLATLKKRQANSFGAVKLARQGIDPFLATLFASRGINDISDIYPDFSELLPVEQLKNAIEMASILADCVANQKRVLIVSDYDCDGATACSILVCAFNAAGMNFGYLVPDRMVHGYGLTASIVEEAATLSPKPDFIITVDNGISSVEGVDRAKALGIEVLVTDHHCAPEVLPAALLIVNPNQPGCEFPSKHIAGCGVAWYVAKALCSELVDRGYDRPFDPMDLLPFVAIGTVADVVQLDKNNRMLVREGLDRIRAGECTVGIQALASVSKKLLHTLSDADIGFGIGPRINAAGRLAHMSGGIECLTTSNKVAAIAMAKELNAINEDRKVIQQEIVDEAFSQAISSLPTGTVPLAIIVYGKDWHEGVVGVVAGRLKEDKYRPTIVLCDDKDGNIKGSCRSIDRFHLKHALDKVNVRFPGVLLKFGGHAMAAGLTIAGDKLNVFKSAFLAVCEEELHPDMLEKVLFHDGKFPAAELTIDSVKRIGLEVWGQGFPEPVFIDDFEVTGSKVLDKDGKHLKLTVRVGFQDVPLLAFGHGDKADTVSRKLSTAFRPQVNVFKGIESLQFIGENIDFGTCQDKLVPAKPPASPDQAPESTRKNRFFVFG